ncbi:MAG TPA: DUF262 domain-containing protein [Elusimicrobiota bacterium]|nr:DUF262 domain-containing protein [Elusimicrobiota bacterium]
MEDLPKPNTQALSWFYGEHKKEALLLQPKYQRNPIWSIGQKCFLVDSIISGCPIPQVFINIRTMGKGTDKKTIYEVVDGQQRLRTILEFMTDQWSLVQTTADSYPVSQAYKPQVGKKYSELPDDLQNKIWNYQLPVQELRDWDDSRIRALFRRLNYVVERLNKQEMRHSQFFGEFVKAVERLSQDSFWDDAEFFTRKASQRMKDVEFISELFVILVDGVQDGQESLDRFYSDYDVVFPNRQKHEAKFHQTLDSLRTILPYLKSSRFSKKADFYGLFAAAAEVNQQKAKVVNLEYAVERLRELAGELEKSQDELKGRAARYYGTIIEGPNKLAKRKMRCEILADLLKP